ncbi:putative Glutathione s-transferase [Colletotrichum higginsianum IMI 349063]|uniref:Putative Glutathione s-transferase n=1 Tax=Colletotrichum higginsianum (strain IMI 349063) TaxID=759273 RepID=A0A1B7YRX3_COLHI|nr:putative Glutathione s-transferase [Colletotrichum higginsianum IMI 349063]OBR14805.1 putative Glutathione s-transferase [Colletotrichum higginsianum IMI 349063]
MKPIKIYGYVAGPHPWKVVILLKELGVPYEIEFLTAEEMKVATYIDVCPNGRVPTIVDPNHDITLCDRCIRSGTIIEYLEDMDDQDDKLKYSTFPEKYHQKNWKDYQIAGHDLFLGQKAYFTMFHTDQDITSVYEQYGNMARWVLGVVERQLAKTGHPYVVGDMCTYADLMYIPFHFVLPDKLMRNVSDEFEQVSKGKFPQCYEWNTWIVGRESVQQALEEEYRAMDAAGWPR